MAEPELDEADVLAALLDDELSWYEADAFLPHENARRWLRRLAAARIALADKATVISLSCVEVRQLREELEVALLRCELLEEWRSAVVDESK